MENMKICDQWNLPCAGAGAGIGCSPDNFPQTLLLRNQVLMLIMN